MEKKEIDPLDFGELVTRITIIREESFSFNERDYGYTKTWDEAIAEGCRVKGVSPAWAPVVRAMVNPATGGLYHDLYEWTGALAEEAKRNGA